ncbi:hypothetical protein BDEG_26698 [Batrachochytrium dendrobatidis JEL423]|uniref:Uncharacterized protein n=1 Tax=Batrachochytrium dendrobatidis (strain JEL423) TaxID=403673 RepID=A0A177WV45_BATDL|nr:hypothetical protein BDEG_26698 [Batrachochytrium dendrobatidis JEL423]
MATKNAMQANDQEISDGMDIIARLAGLKANLLEPVSVF